MIDVSKYKVDSRGLVSMLTPYFLKGDKVIKFLSALISPMDDDNTLFVEWARDKIIDAVSTSQPIVLKWCLDNKMYKWLKDKNSHFNIILFNYVGSCIIYNDKEEAKSSEHALKEYVPEDKTEDVTSIVRDELAFVFEKSESKQKVDIVTIQAPQHVSTISDDKYIKLIKQIVETYRIYDIKYLIKIKD